jgi:UDP-glucose 4-epimerase
MKKILITGGAGFIGSHLVDKLINENYTVIIVDNLSTGKKENINLKAKFYKLDILNPKIFEVFKKEKPEIVFHLAAQVNVRKSVEDPINDAKINILGFLNILEACRKFNVKKIIFSSSGGAIYGETKIIPTPENYLPNPESPYGIAKLIVEKYLDFYKKVYGLDYIALRFANVYGSRQDPKGEAGVVSIFIEKIFKGERPIIFGNGKQTRDFIYVDDIVSALIKSISYKGKETIFNVGTDIETSVNQLFKLISKILRAKTKPIYVSPKPGELKRNCLNISKIKKELKWQPKYNLEKGFKETIKWFRYIL